jgi:hypothetical protein
MIIVRLARIRMKHSSRPHVIVIVSKYNQLCYCFLQYVYISIGGWGGGLRRIVWHWYTKQDPLKLARMVCHRNSEHGWCHKDLIRLSHFKIDDKSKLAIKYYELLFIKKATMLIFLCLCRHGTKSCCGIHLERS